MILSAISPEPWLLRMHKLKTEISHVNHILYSEQNIVLVILFSTNLKQHDRIVFGGSVLFKSA
jgi:hypothetical protein